MKLTQRQPKKTERKFACYSKKIDILHRENNPFKEAHAEQTRYTRRWDHLRMIGLTEKDGEDTREIVLGILI